MNNEMTTTCSSLVAYNPSTDLVEVRLNPDKYPRLDRTAPEQAFALMKEIVVSAYMYRGQQAEESMVDFTTANLLAELLDPHNGYGTQHLSWFEVARAIKRGILGMGKEMYGISVSSLYAVILEYVKGEGHNAEVKAHRVKVAPKLSAGMQIAIDSAAGGLARAITQRTKESYNESKAR